MISNKIKRAYRKVRTEATLTRSNNLFQVPSRGHWSEIAVSTRSAHTAETYWGPKVNFQGWFAALLQSIKDKQIHPKSYIRWELKLSLNFQLWLIYCSVG